MANVKLRALKIYKTRVVRAKHRLGGEEPDLSFGICYSENKRIVSVGRVDRFGEDTWVYSKSSEQTEQDIEEAELDDPEDVRDIILMKWSIIFSWHGLIPG